MNWSCRSCGAEWGAGAFTLGCAECGGGAMTMPCLWCGGRCGRWSQRAPMDSNDARVAHWGFRCGLPDDEQQAILLATVESARAAPPSSPPSLALLSAIHPARAAGQDRVAIFPLDEGAAIVLSDGAGGTGDGAAAAERVLRVCAAELPAGAEPEVLLAACDGALASDGIGLATAVVAVVHGERIVGASVGDSAAWLIARGTPPVELTANQARRPLLGDGFARPTRFEARLTGTLVVGSDGLFAYAPRAAILAAAAAPSLSALASALVAAARLPSGGLQDDLSLALCRR